jgi:hypothetical protein
MNPFAISLSEIRALEERSFNAWPALQTVLVDGWVLRFSNAFTKRANSANALMPTGSFSTIKVLSETLYARRGQRAVFRLTPLAGIEPDRVLNDAGYIRLDETCMCTAMLDVKSHACSVDSSVMICGTPTEAWCSGVASANSVSSNDRVTHDQMLMSLRLPSAFAVLEHESVPVAFGFAVLDRGMVGLFDVVTVPTARRQGHARRLVSALLAWGQSHGASGAYLQVVASNISAITLHAQLGFREMYRYHYRVQPSESL